MTRLPPSGHADATRLPRPPRRTAQWSLPRPDQWSRSTRSGTAAPSPRR